MQMTPMRPASGCDMMTDVCGVRERSYLPHARVAWRSGVYTVCVRSWCFFFFFQAEDGIRDLTVTGVQTCALPIFLVTPQVYVAYGVTPKLGVGIGLFAPYGLQTRWPLSFDGRFSGYDNILRSVYVQPTVSYQVTPWLSLGGGVDVVFGSVELNQRLDLADAPVPTALGVPAGTLFSQFGIAPGTDFADTHLEASKTTVAGHFGALFQSNDRRSFGARFMTQSKLVDSGTASFTQVLTGLVVPADLTVGSLTIAAGCPIDALLTAPAAPCGGNRVHLFNPAARVFRAPPGTTPTKNPSQKAAGGGSKGAR